MRLVWLSEVDRCCAVFDGNRVGCERFEGIEIEFPNMPIKVVVLVSRARQLLQPLRRPMPSSGGSSESRYSSDPDADMAPIGIHFQGPLPTRSSLTDPVILLIQHYIAL